MSVLLDQHLHCWKDKREWAAEQVPEYSDAFFSLMGEAWETGATCMLPAGHDGEHDFTPDDQITISFPAREEPAP